MMRRSRALVVVLAGLAACRDDGGNDEAEDDDPSGPSTDPDDTGADTEDDGPTTDPDDTGPSDESSTGEPVEPIDPDALDDEFDAGLDGWSTFNGDLAGVAVSN